MHTRLAGALCAVACTFASLAHARSPADALTLDGTRYEFRWTNGTQYEYTPTGSEDLKRWTRMITLQPVPPVATEADLRGYVQMLADHFARNGQVIAHDCVASLPRGTECRVVAVLGATDVAELVVNRTVLIDGRATNVSIGHRVYGTDAGTRQLAYLQSPEGKRYAQAALTWVPPLDSLPTATQPPQPASAPTLPALTVDGVAYEHAFSDRNEQHWVLQGETHDTFSQEVVMVLLPGTVDRVTLQRVNTAIAGDLRGGGIVIEETCTPESVPEPQAECTVIGVRVRGGDVADVVVNRVARGGATAVNATLIKRLRGEGLVDRVRDWVNSAEGNRQLAAWRSWPIPFGMMRDVAPTSP